MAGRRILAVGSESQVRRYCGPGTETIDCQGKALLPAFVDPHCHLLAYTASLLSVDCSPGAANSIAEIQDTIRRRAAATPPGAWIRAFGYSETDLADGRHPTRRDLDTATPSHPVRLIHRSGHACVLNSLALRLCGIDISSEEPPGGYMERDRTTGEPTGLLLEMDEAVERAVPPLPYGELAQGLAAASRRLLAAGVTAIQDVTATNSPAELRLLERLRKEGHLRQQLVAAVGYQAMDKVEPGTVRPVKVAIKELGDAVERLQNDPRDREPLKLMLRRIRRLRELGRIQPVSTPDKALTAVEELILQIADLNATVGPGYLTVFRHAREVMERLQAGEEDGGRAP
ncbi:MAG: amidohydrolase family protein, partial [Dehalococcoidia bacterium]